MLDFKLPVTMVWKCVMAGLGAAFVAPWVLAAVLATAARVVRTARRAYGAGRAVVVDTVRCPRGHQSELHGVFECRCGALFAGWAFQNCPICAESCGYVACERCGMSVRNPVIVALERGR